MATLRECTIQREKGGSDDEAVVTSACVQSVISAIPSQEIQRMIQEVKALDEETLKVKKKQTNTKGKPFLNDQQLKAASCHHIEVSRFGIIVSGALKVMLIPTEFF